MNADIKGALNQLNTSWKSFTHNGMQMTKEQVKSVLEYASQVGYKTTDEIPDKDIDEIIDKINRRGKTIYKTKLFDSK